LSFLSEFLSFVGLRIFYEKIYKRYRILITKKKVKKVAKIFGKGIEKNIFVKIVTYIKQKT
jgi:formate/nitrite transporter FocA (FNT family)